MSVNARQVARERKFYTFLFACILSVVFLQSDIKVISWASARVTEPLSRLPDFSKISDVQLKKQTFFDTLYPIIEAQNLRILALRQEIIALQSVDPGRWTEQQQRWLDRLCEDYKVEPQTHQQITIALLLERVDYIPPSLVLSQAAIESAWGTSRFARQGNNLFGQWCFVKGCGMVPTSRSAGKAHELATFSTVDESVEAYLRNLNTYKSYEQLRQRRKQLREHGKAITGLEIAKLLGNYSQEGHVYVSKVSAFISHNKLQRYTRAFEKAILVAQNKAEH